MDKGGLLLLTSLSTTLKFLIPAGSLVKFVQPHSYQEWGVKLRNISSTSDNKVPGDIQ
uniref:Uncharacterized protein n=1 Tax=Octopus bimaculoides TaxID=37653 RepID=A0A0L8H1A6_OCTBM